MTEIEERKQTLPVGHPQAGYVSPDLSLEVDAGTRPKEEQKNWEEQNAAQKDAAEAIAKHEHKTAVAESKQQSSELAATQAKK
jgi:hypothetical protein